MTTGRLEAFSDGVFGVAITLLVFNLHAPQAADLAHRSLAIALLQEWPLYIAYVTSFLTLLVVWINHHQLFTLIGRVDRVLLFLNGLLLMTVAVIPFPTSIVSENLPGHDASIAAAIYAGTFLLLALLFNAIWFYASSDGRLLHPGDDGGAMKPGWLRYWIGPPLYLIALLLALVNPWAGVLLCMAMIAFYAFPARSSAAAS